MEYMRMVPCICILLYIGENNARFYMNKYKINFFFFNKALFLRRKNFRIKKINCSYFLKLK